MSNPLLDLNISTTRLVLARSRQEKLDAVSKIHEALLQLEEDPPEPDRQVIQNLLIQDSTRLVAEGATLRSLSDEILETFNSLLPWAAMTLDEKGRVVGSHWSAHKRQLPHPAIDPRQVAFDKEYPLADRHVFEVGCFEGIQTLGCLRLGARVTATDGRMENVLKTLARLWLYGFKADVVFWNLEREAPAVVPESWDILHHIGVLYHLEDPVRHLKAVCARTTGALLLDTHIATSETTAVDSYEVDGTEYKYARYREKFIDASPFAGLVAYARWLSHDSLLGLLKELGFGRIDVIADEKQRNGRRIHIWAFR